MRSSAKEVSFEWEIPFFMHIPSMTGMIQTGPYLLNVIPAGRLSHHTVWRAGFSQALIT